MVEMFMGYGTIKDGKLVSLQSGHFPQVLVGLDASKPTPSVFDTYMASDTGKTYICFVNGYWALISSTSKEIYSNHLGIVDNIQYSGVSGVGTATINSANHRMDLSGGIGVGTAYYSNYISASLVNATYEYNIKVQNIVNGATDSRLTFIGLTNSPTAVAGDGVFFCQLADDTWKCTSTQFLVGQENTSITAIANGDLLTIRGQKTNTMFLVNGVIVATHTFIPNVVYSPQVIVQSAAGTTVARQISVDYVNIEVLI